MEIIDRFGYDLITKVRDETISQAINVLNGNVFAPTLKELSIKLSLLSDEEKNASKLLLIKTIDDCLFNLMILLEEENEHYQLIISDGSTKINLYDEEDELHARLMCWYDFSEYDYY